MTAWNSADHYRSISFSASDKTATSGGSTSGSLANSARSLNPKSSGKWVVRIKCTAINTGQVYFWTVGLCTSSYDASTADNIPGFESTVNSWCVARDGIQHFQNGTGGGNFTSPIVLNDFVDIACDVPNTLVWFRRVASDGTPDSSGWNPGGAGGPDPVAGNGGIRMYPGGSGDWVFAAPPWHFTCGAGSDGVGDDAFTIVQAPTLTGFSDWSTDGDSGGGGGGSFTLMPQICL